MEDAEFGSPLPIAHVMRFFETHLHHLKRTAGFTAAFAFIVHRLYLVCKIASIELHYHMYLLGVSTNSATDKVNKVQNQLNHVSTQGSKLESVRGTQDHPTSLVSNSGENLREQREGRVSIR